jgi:ribosomal protein S18 acetylase RimI-like enzyme
MDENVRQRFAPIQVSLKDGRLITIRFLEPRDVAALGDFYESVPREDVRFYCPHPLTRQKAAEKAAEAAGPRLVALVAESSTGEIVGYAWYRWKADDSRSSGLGICIRRDHQGIGTGRALMPRLLEVARDVGPPLMTLTVQKANARAVALYQQMGFRIVAEQMRRAFDEFPAEPEYRMELRVR